MCSSKRKKSYAQRERRMIYFINNLKNKPVFSVYPIVSMTATIALSVFKSKPYYKTGEML
jgi:hypothetical protein